MADRSIITLESLAESQKKIAELIGMDAYMKLVDEYGGMNIYIQNHNDSIRNTRNDEIRALYRVGTPYRHLAAKYRLSEMAIRLIVADIDKENKENAVKAQTEFY
jgi:Mor transcription activator family.